jgi:hypothetical protein
MTREEALQKAETRVWCYMNEGDIDYYFNHYHLAVADSYGKKKSHPNRGEKEDALIQYLTEQILGQSDAKTEAQQQAYAERFMHDMEVITRL